MYELDQEQDEKAPQAPKAAPAPLGTPTPQAPQAAPASNATGRFVGFDQLLTMNRPAAQATSNSLLAGANATAQKAEGALAGTRDTFMGQVNSGTHVDGGMTEYAGPTAYAENAFDDARKAGEAARGQFAALSTRDGTQVALQQKGQSVNAARYNSLFANAVGGGQAREAANRFGGFDSLIDQTRTAGNQAAQSASAAAQKASADQAAFLQGEAANSPDAKKRRYQEFEAKNRDYLARLTPENKKKYLNEKLGPGVYEAVFGAP